MCPALKGAPRSVFQVKVQIQFNPVIGVFAYVCSQLRVSIFSTIPLFIN